MSTRKVFFRWRSYHLIASLLTYHGFHGDGSNQTGIHIKLTVAITNVIPTNVLVYWKLVVAPGFLWQGGDSSIGLGIDLGMFLSLTGLTVFHSPPPLVQPQFKPSELRQLQMTVSIEKSFQNLVLVPDRGSLPTLSSSPWSICSYFSTIWTAICPCPHTSFT